MNYIFIDEIQDIVGFERVIRSLLTKKNTDIYITGSNARIFSSELATLLAGRTVEIPVYPLSYGEFLQFHELEDSQENLQCYLQYGGMPFLHHLGIDQDKAIRDYLDSVYHTVVYRDIVSRHQLRNTAFLETLIHFLADNVGSLFSAKNISDYLKEQKTNISSGQIQQYAEHLDAAFLVHQVERYDIQGKRIFEYGHKYYFGDTGLRHTLTGFRPTDLGKIVENVVYMELLRRGYQVWTGGLRDREIDFVLSRNNEWAYVQVALRLEEQKTIDREFGNLLQIGDQFPKKVITLEEHFPNTYQGIVHQNLRAFLLEE